MLEIRRILIQSVYRLYNKNRIFTEIKTNTFRTKTHIWIQAVYRTVFISVQIKLRTDSSYMYANQGLFSPFIYTQEDNSTKPPQ